MKRKITAIALCAVMFATAIIGGTLAYFTDTEAVTNTMAVGNISINIEELAKQSDGTYAPFKNNEFMLFPMSNVDGANKANKVVITMNDSPSGKPAYIRTFLLFEANEKVEACDDDCCVGGLHFSYYQGYGDSYLGNELKDYGVTSKRLFDRDTTVTVGEKEYYAVLCENSEKKAIAVNEGLAALKSVWMDKDVTQEQAEGWGNDGVQILAFSQAIQAEELTYEEAMKALDGTNGITVDYIENLFTHNKNNATINDFVKVEVNK